MQRNLLIARGALNLAFALYFLVVPAADGAANFLHCGVYLAADGLVALLVAGVLLRAPYSGWLAGMASADAVARVGLGLWFLLVPGLQSYVTTRIFVLVIVCLSALLLGAAGILIPLVLRSASHWPLVLASAALLAFGAALGFVFPDVAGMRILIGLYALALGAALLAGGLRHKGGLAAARR